MEEELARAFRKLKQREVDTFPATVVSVDKEKGTCVVSDGQLEYTGVQLSSVVDGNAKKFFLFPKVKSSVLVSPIMEDLKRLYVEAYSEIESLVLVIESVEFKIDKDGFLLKKENETLKQLMSDLLDAIDNISFTVTTPDTINGSTTLLNNKAQFSNIKIRFNKFLKGN